MIFGQLIEHHKIFFFKNYAENEAGKLIPDRLFSLKSFILIR